MPEDLTTRVDKAYAQEDKKGVIGIIASRIKDKFNKVFDLKDHNLEKNQQAHEIKPLFQMHDRVALEECHHLNLIIEHELMPLSHHLLEYLF